MKEMGQRSLSEFPRSFLGLAGTVWEKLLSSLSREIKNSNDEMCSQGSGEVIREEIQTALNYTLPARGYQKSLNRITAATVAVVIYHSDDFW